MGAFEAELVTDDSPGIRFQETNGQVVMEAEHYIWNFGGGEHTWSTQTYLSGATGPGYLNALPDTDRQLTTTYTNIGPQLDYTINFTTTGAYTIWLRGYAPNAAGDSIYVSLDNSSAITLTGFSPQQWSWANINTQGGSATVEVTESGLHTLHFWMREDGLRLDRIVLTTDNNYNPTGNGPAESGRFGN